MKRRVGILVLACSLPILVVATPAIGAPPNPLGSLPSGVSFKQITKAQHQDIIALTGMVSVARFTWGPDANAYGACSDPTTGGPDIVLVEQGHLIVSLFPASDQTGDFPRYVKIGADGSPQPPVAVLPETRLDLQVGDLIAFPNGSACGLDGNYGTKEKVTFLEVVGFPAGPTAQSVPSLGEIAEPLDLDVGIASARPPSPPSVLIGYLTVGPKAKLPLASLSVPLIFSVASGSGSFSTDMQGAVVRRAGTPSFDPSEPLQPGVVATINVGDGSYVLPGTTGAIENTGDHALKLYVIAVLPGTSPSATPTASAERTSQTFAGS